MSESLVVSPSTAHRAAVTSFGFTCTLRDSGRDAAWVHVTGELDIATAPQLEQTLRLAEARAPRLVLDLRELTFMDSCGVHVIVDANIRARAAQHQLVLVRGPSQVDRVLALSKAADALQIIDLHPAQPPVQALVELAQRERAA